MTLSLLQAFKAMDDIMSPSAENDKELYRSVLFLTGVIAIFHRHSIRGWRCQVTCPLFDIARIKPFQSQSKNNIDLNGEMKLHPVGDWVVQTILLSLSCSVNKDSLKAVSFEETKYRIASNSTPTNKTRFGRRRKESETQHSKKSKFAVVDFKEVKWTAE